MLTVNRERHGVDTELAMPPFQSPCGPLGPPARDLPARSAFSPSIAQEQDGSRSECSVSRAFDACSFLDQRAAEIGRDPLQFLMSMLDEEGTLDPYLWVGGDVDKTPPHERRIRIRRMRNVLLLAVTRSGWRSSLPARNGRGIALGGNGVTHVAVSARVAVAEDGRVSVLRIDLVADCGAVANPDSVTTAFKDAARVALDKVLSGWRTPAPERISRRGPATVHVPPASVSANIRVHIVRSDAASGCVSQAAIAPVMAAITNGVFAATGHRLRALPVDPSLLQVRQRGERVDGGGTGATDDECQAEQQGKMERAHGASGPQRGHPAHASKIAIPAVPVKATVARTDDYIPEPARQQRTLKADFPHGVAPLLSKPNRFDWRA